MRVYALSKQAVDLQKTMQKPSDYEKLWRNVRYTVRQL